jgi:hypothetical protein
LFSLFGGSLQGAVAEGKPLDPNGLFGKLVEGKSAIFAGDLFDIIAQLKSQGNAPELSNFLESLGPVGADALPDLIKESLEQISPEKKKDLLDEMELLLAAPTILVPAPPLPSPAARRGELNLEKAKTAEERSIAALDSLIAKLSGGQPILVPEGKKAKDKPLPLAEFGKSTLTEPALQDLAKSIKEALSKTGEKAAQKDSDNTLAKVMPDFSPIITAPEQFKQILKTFATKGGAEGLLQETKGIEANLAQNDQSGQTGAPTHNTHKSMFVDELNAVKSTHGTPHTPVANQVAVHLQRAATAGQDKITIRLQPPELGRIDVKLELGGDGRVMAHVTADNSITLDLLRRDQSGLERALADAGLKTDGSSLNFNLRGDGQRYSGQQGEGQNGQAGNGRAATTDTVLPDSNILGSLELSWFVSPERVDVRI